MSHSRKDTDMVDCILGLMCEKGEGARRARQWLQKSADECSESDKKEQQYL